MPKKILIIEDDQRLNKIYSIKLNQEGIETSIAVDGEEGWRKLTGEKPDLVLLDLMIPVKDGFAILEERAKNPELMKIPVLVLSNLGQDSDVERAKKLGASEYLVKANFSIQGIVDKIKEYLQ
ncbi:MAG: response regulator [Patescibacteria group bacterium]